MLTGALPHPALTSKQSLVQRLTARPLTLAEVKPSVPWPPRVQKALDRALAPEPDDRYSNVLDFARDVRAATGLPTFQGAAIVAGAATRAMTPAVVPAVSAVDIAAASDNGAAETPTRRPAGDYRDAGRWRGRGCHSSAGAASRPGEWHAERRADAGAGECVRHDAGHPPSSDGDSARGRG